MLEAFSIPFITILFAELLDKSQLAVLLLATKTKQHALLLLGVMSAFVLVDGSAILFGSLLTTLLPAFWLKIIAGSLFIFFGAISLYQSRDEEKQTVKLTNPLVSGFFLVFLSEWGDKTQLASAVFATQYDPIFVFGGVVTALFVLSLLAVSLSKVILKYINPNAVQKIAGVLFILLGIIFLATK